MSKAVKFIETMGTDEYRKLVSSPFDYNILGHVNNVNVPILFKGWIGKNYPTHVSYTSDNNPILYFYLNYMEIRKIGLVVRLPIPTTIYDFIECMCLNEVDLYWSDWIDAKFQPKDYLPQNKIEDYYADLLNKMDKSHELNTERYGELNKPSTMG